MRILISDALRRSGKIELLGTGKNGKEGVDLVNKFSPDVVLTDMVMPEYDGLYLVKNVMLENPTPVLVLSALNKDSHQIFDALHEGAVDFVEKNVQAESDNTVFDEILLRKITIASESKFGKKRRAKKNNTAHTFKENLNYDIIALGSSTGGPSALESIIKRLPSNLSIPVVIAQHMPERFIESFAKRLNAEVDFTVKVAEKGEVVRVGTIYLMPGHTNTKIIRDINSGELTFAFTTKKYVEFNHPSVDCLFESLERATGKKTLAAILTGMGKDGINGMRKLQAKGAFTIAQDEASSVVFGMPKFAIDNKVVNRVVSLKDMPAFIVSCCDL